MPGKVRLMFSRFRDDPLWVLVDVTRETGDGAVEMLAYRWKDAKREMLAANVFSEGKMKQIDFSLLHFGNSQSEETEASIEDVTRILRTVLRGVEIFNFQR